MAPAVLESRLRPHIVEKGFVPVPELPLHTIQAVVSHNPTPGLGPSSLYFLHGPPHPPSQYSNSQPTSDSTSFALCPSICDSQTQSVQERLACKQVAESILQLHPLKKP